MTATTVRDTAAATGYEFGTGRPTGSWLGLSTGQLAVAGGGLLAGIGVLASGGPVLLAAGGFLAALLTAVIRVAGRPVTGWLAPVAAHTAAASTGTARWRGPLTVPTRHAELRPLRLPREYGRPTLLAAGSDLGLILDPSDRTVTAVFEVAGIDRFPLLDPVERDTLLAAWGDCLAVLADGDAGVRRLQLIDRASSHPGDRRQNGLEPPADRRADYRALARELDELSTAHTGLLAVQWTHPARATPDPQRAAARCATVTRALLAGRLAARPLSVDELTADLAVGIRGPGPTRNAVEPGSRRCDWSHVRVDDTVHRSYAIAGWPATPVPADWLSPLLLTTPPAATRTVSLHLQHLPAAAAARTARTLRAKASLDQADRIRFGLVTSAAADQADASGAALDAELAAGYRAHRLTGVLTLTAASLAAVDAAEPLLRATAAASRLDLRPLHGQHHRGLAATVPLCRVRPQGQP